MKRIITAILLLTISSTLLAKDIKFSRDELQQTINSYMPFTQQQNILQITISQPDLSLNSEEQRVQISAHVHISTALGGKGEGWVTLDGILRYRNTNHSFYVNDLRVIDLEVEGLPKELKPVIQRFTQEVISPLLAEQPIYTLTDNNMQESLAKMMLRSITIRENHVIASLSMF